MKTKIEQTNAPGWSPGPWRTGTKERGRFCVYADNNSGKGICVMSNTQKSWGPDYVAKFGEHGDNLEADANARLIASAPEMAEALWALVVAAESFNDSTMRESKALHEARALLARIGGAS